MCRIRARLHLPRQLPEMGATVPACADSDRRLTPGIASADRSVSPRLSSRAPAASVVEGDLRAFLRQVVITLINITGKL